MIHHVTFYAWWTGTVIVLYLGCILAVLKLPVKAAPFMVPLGALVAIYGGFPTFFFFGHIDHLWQTTLFCIVPIALALVPMTIAMRRQANAYKQAEAQRAEQAERLIQGFGA